MELQNKSKKYILSEFSTVIIIQHSSHIQRMYTHRGRLCIWAFYYMVAGYFYTKRQYLTIYMYSKWRVCLYSLSRGCSCSFVAIIYINPVGFHKTITTIRIHYGIIFDYPTMNTISAYMCIRILTGEIFTIYFTHNKGYNKNIDF